MLCYVMLKRRHTPELAASCRLFGLDGRGTSSGRGTLYSGIPETVLSLVEKGFSRVTRITEMEELVCDKMIPQSKIISEAQIAQFDIEI